MTRPAYKNFNEVWEERFTDMLKEGKDTNPATSTDTKDEERSTVGTTHVHEEPEDKGEVGTIDASWGEEPPSSPENYSDAAEKGNEEGGQKLLKRVLDSKPTASKADQALIAQNFTRGASGNFETHSPLLKEKSKLSHARASTILERVRALTDIR
jgi:hypothetical protein